MTTAGGLDWAGVPTGPEGLAFLQAGVRCGCAQGGDPVVPPNATRRKNQAPASQAAQTCGERELGAPRAGELDWSRVLGLQGGAVTRHDGDTTALSIDYHLDKLPPPIVITPRTLCLELRPEGAYSNTSRVRWARCSAGYRETFVGQEAGSGPSLALEMVDLAKMLEKRVSAVTTERAPAELLATWPSFASVFDLPGFRWRYHEISHETCQRDFGWSPVAGAKLWLVQALQPYVAYRLVGFGGVGETCEDNRLRAFFRVQFWVGLINHFAVFAPADTAASTGPYAIGDLPEWLYSDRGYAKLGGRVAAFGQWTRGVAVKIQWDGGAEGKQKATAIYPCDSRFEDMEVTYNDAGAVTAPCTYARQERGGSSDFYATACAFNDPAAYEDAEVEGREDLPNADLIEPVDLENFTRAVSMFGLVVRAQVRAQTLADGSQYTISQLWDQAFDYAFGERQYIEYTLQFDGADGVLHTGTSTFCLSQDDLVPVEDVVRQVTQARQTEEGKYMFQSQDVQLLEQEVARALDHERQNEYDMFSPEACPCSDPRPS